MTPKTKFTEGEKVLCFHGPLIYEAKCLKVQVKEKEKTVKYFVHYAGWNKNWDEWVTESRVLKLNDANLTRQKDLQKAHEASLKQKKAKKILEKKKEGTPTPGRSGSSKDRSSSGGEDSRSSTPSMDRSSSGPGKRSSSAVAGGTASETASNTDGEEREGRDDSSQDGKKKKVKLEATVETEEQFLGHVEVRVKLPDELKTCLVNDWDLVNRQRKLTALPSRITVNTILSDYTLAKVNAKANTPNKESAILEVVAGLKEYFNVMLGKQLLYKFERPQYADILRERPSDPPAHMADVYGYIHLVRLFVKMGEMLAYTMLDEKSTAMLNFHLHDFLRFLVKNMSTYYCTQDYGIAPADYQRRAL